MRRTKRAGAALVMATALLATGVTAVSANLDNGSSERSASDKTQPKNADRPNDQGQIHGGSNYNFFDLDGCNREDFGVLKNFHTHRQKITGQLEQMHANGQDRLIIGIFHGHGLDSGTLIDSAGGDLPEQQRQNLADLLATVRSIGYAEVEVVFHVLGPNDPNQWQSWNEDLYQENLQLIRNLRPIVEDSGLLYRLNLGNELTPAPNQPQTLQYTKRLWQDYVSEFGREDTVGFSIIGSRPERIANIPAMYGDKPPYLFDFHFYGDENADEYQQFVNAHNQMRDMGYNQGWIIGETFYNDPTSAENLRRAINDTGREVYWLTQWPWQREARDTGGCEHVSISPPADFDAFLDQGF